MFCEKNLRPAQRKQLVGHLIDRYRISIQRACRVCLQSRAGWYQRPKGKPLDEALRARMREIAITRVRFGFWRIYVLLRLEGWKVDHKRIYRLYKAEGLNLRTKRPRRRKAAANCMDRILLTAPNRSWSMDFVSDASFGNPPVG
jgi:putative transposase